MPIVIPATSEGIRPLEAGEDSCLDCKVSAGRYCYSCEGCDDATRFRCDTCDEPITASDVPVGLAILCGGGSRRRWVRFCSVECALDPDESDVERNMREFLRRLTASAPEIIELMDCYRSQCEGWRKRCRQLSDELAKLRGSLLDEDLPRHQSHHQKEATQ